MTWLTAVHTSNKGKGGPRGGGRALSKQHYALHVIVRRTCMLIAVGVVCVSSKTMKKSGSGAAKTCHRCAKTTIPVPKCIAYL